jgi:hypothetical protein
MGAFMPNERKIEDYENDGNGILPEDEDASMRAAFGENWNKPEPAPNLIVHADDDDEIIEIN